MKPRTLTISNVKSIAEAEFVLNGKTRTITGDNGTGKTAIIEAIKMLFGGKQSHPGYEVIRHGADDAEVGYRLDGDLLVQADITKTAKSGESIKRRVWRITTEEGKERKVILNADTEFERIKGLMSSDPLAMVRLAKEGPEGRRKVAKMVRDFMQVDIDLSLYGIELQPNEHPLDAIARQSKAVFDERSKVNAKVDDLQAQLAGIVIPEKYKDAKPVDVTALNAEKDKLTARQREVDKLLSEVEKCDTAILTANGYLATSEKAVKIAEEALARAKSTLEQAQADVATARTLYVEAKEAADATKQEQTTIDTKSAEIDTAFANAQETNRYAQMAEGRKAIETKLAAVKAEQEAKNTELTELKELTATAESQAQLPVKGMRYDPDEGLIVGDTALAGRSYAEACGDTAQFVAAALAKRVAAGEPVLPLIPVDQAGEIGPEIRAAIENGVAAYFKDTPDQTPTVVYFQYAPGELRLE